MSEGKKPIFPRSSESSEENIELIQETRQKLQTEESIFGVALSDGGQNVYCIRCGRENSATGRVCGSCGFSLNNATEKHPVDEVPVYETMTPVYGPPPMWYQPVKTNEKIIQELRNERDSIANPIHSSAKNRWIIWIIVFILFAGILLIVFLKIMK